MILKINGAGSNWGEKPAEGVGRGVAYVLSSGAATAVVVEVVQRERGIEVVQCFVAADVGIVLDPRNTEAQVSGALIYGLTAAMRGQITVTDGTVDQDNFDSYELLRIYETPPVVVQVVESGEGIFGVGESATPGAAPALGNAIFAANGERLRELPFRHSVRFARLASRS